MPLEVLLLRPRQRTRDLISHLLQAAGGGRSCRAPGGRRALWVFQGRGVWASTPVSPRASLRSQEELCHRGSAPRRRHVGDIRKPTWVPAGLGAQICHLRLDCLGQGLPERIRGGQTHTHMRVYTPTPLHTHLKCGAFPEQIRFDLHSFGHRDTTLPCCALETGRWKGLGNTKVFSALPSPRRAARSARSLGAPKCETTALPGAEVTNATAGEEAGEDAHSWLQGPSPEGARSLRSGSRAVAGIFRGPRVASARPLAPHPREEGQRPQVAPGSIHPTAVSQPASAAQHPGLLRTPRRGGGAAGGRDGDRCAPRPMAEPAALPGPPSARANRRLRSASSARRGAGPQLGASGLRAVA
ncbi:hypothetical protein P7K49_026031 [Saguinus oedipus]|uniref:Uncharacterized protein n=1 Tax=Saguinus oedipus TaxID=9490 RepID=A0ABQ9UL81_SAGOE|nr:hypothetical protein P7K49_026031 [Saguinus oedipus]